MNKSINCLTLTVVSPVLILWRLTPGSWTTRISRCDSKNSLTCLRFSTFPHLSYAVSQALLVTSHPLPRGPAAPSACDLIQNHYCTPHLTEVYTQPPPRAPETPSPPLLALKKLTITQHWLVLSSISQSHGALVQSGNTFFTIDTKHS